VEEGLGSTESNHETPIRGGTFAYRHSKLPETATVPDISLIKKFLEWLDLTYLPRTISFEGRRAGINTA